MAEFKVGDRFLLPDGDDGHLIEVQRTRPSFFMWWMFF